MSFHDAIVMSPLLAICVLNGLAFLMLVQVHGRGRRVFVFLYGFLFFPSLFAWAAWCIIDPTSSRWALAAMIATAAALLLWRAWRRRAVRP